MNKNWYHGVFQTYTSDSHKFFIVFYLKFHLRLKLKFFFENNEKFFK